MLLLLVRIKEKDRHSHEEFIQNYNLPGYTIESGIGKNPLPISQFQDIYDKNIGERRLEDGIYLLSLFFQEESLKGFWETSLGVR